MDTKHNYCALWLPDINIDYHGHQIVTMAAIQAEDVRASFLFVGELNGNASSEMVGFYDHEPSFCCSLRLHNCVRFRSVGCRPNQMSQYELVLYYKFNSLYVISENISHLGVF